MTEVKFGTGIRADVRPALPQRRDDRTVWKIAMGVFLGLTLFGLATCTTLAIIGSAVQQEQEKQAQEAMAEFQRAVSDPDPLGWRKKLHEEQLSEERAKQLKPGERCIQGRRYKRIKDGWISAQEPC